MWGTFSLRRMFSLVSKSCWATLVSRSWNPFSCWSVTELREDFFRVSLFPEATSFVAGAISPLNFKLLSRENFTGFITRQQKETCYCRSWLTLNCSFCRSNELEQVIIENDSFGTLEAMTNMNGPQKTIYSILSSSLSQTFGWSV